MLKTVKLKKGETFASVMKVNKIKDWKMVWRMPETKKLVSKRKWADKVEPGDSVVIPDVQAKTHTIKLNGKSWTFPESEMPRVKKEVCKEMERKFLKRLYSLKKIYDDDYLYMQKLYDDNSFLSWTVQTISGAKIPTKEMNATAKAIKDVQAAIRAQDFKKICATIAKAEVAMKYYVKAAEQYRRDMGDGASNVVSAVELTRDGCFIVAGALMVSIAAPVGGAAAAMAAAKAGAATSFVNACASEIGESVAGNERSAGEISWRIVRETAVGAIVGGAGGAIVGRLGGGISKSLAPMILRSKFLDKAVLAILRNNAPWIAKTLGRKITSDVALHAAQEISKVLVRIGAGVVGASIKKQLNKHLDRVAKAAASAFLASKPGEKDDKVASRVSDALIDTDFATFVVMDVIKNNRKTIIAALDASDTFDKAA